MSRDLFMIGAARWPGVSKLIEEAGEVLQVCGKLVGTGGEGKHWDGSDLKTRLEEELADLLAAIFFVVEHCGLDSDRIDARVHTKTNTFRHWHTESPSKSEERRAVGVSDR